MLANLELPYQLDSYPVMSFVWDISHQFQLLNSLHYTLLYIDLYLHTTCFHIRRLILYTRKDHLDQRGQVLWACSKILLGLKILSGYFNGDLKEVDLPVLKFLYLNDYKVLPKSCPRLEFLKVGFYNADVDRFDSPKLTNLKAMIVPYNDTWATKVIKACKESLEFVHITSEIRDARSLFY